MAKGISLDRFAKGALKAQFNRELAKISSNVWDPNTSPTAKRTITMTVTIKPDENREIGDVDIAVKSTLCPVKAVSTKLVFGYDELEKEGVANEFSTEMLGQIGLEELDGVSQEPEVALSENVIDLRGARTQ